MCTTVHTGAVLGLHLGLLPQPVALAAYMGMRHMTSLWGAAMVCHD